MMYICRKTKLLLILVIVTTWSLRFNEGKHAKDILNRILRQILGPKRDENGEDRWLHSEELHTLYRTFNVVSLIKSTKLRYESHVARIEEGRSVFRIFNR